LRRARALIVAALRNAYAEVHDPNRALGGRPALGVVTLVGRQHLGGRTLPVVEIPAPVLNRRFEIASGRDEWESILVEIQ
jgi:hypothetical protein